MSADQASRPATGGEQQDKGEGHERVCLYLLGQGRVTRQGQAGSEQSVHVQPRLLHLLAYLALNWKQAHRREELQACFWPDAAPAAAANNLRQALWQLRQVLPRDLLLVKGAVVQWNPATPPWVDALAFEAALDACNPSAAQQQSSGRLSPEAGGLIEAEQALDTALSFYVGPFLPDCYDEWTQLERERLHLRYLAALETRGHRRYEARLWESALADALTLLTADPLNEAAARLVMACHWALGQREAARRCYDSFRRLVRSELQTDPLPETAALYQRILAGEPHPDQLSPATNRAIAAQAAHLSLLESLGAFRQGLEQATAWAASANGPALAEALRWQGCFYLRLGQLIESRAALSAALPLAHTADQQAIILAGLATAETGLGDYSAAADHYTQALSVPQMGPTARLRLLIGLGGLLGRMGRLAEACRTLEEAIRLARQAEDPAQLAMASGNLAILLIGQQKTAAAEEALNEALVAARRADAHWLTAHLTGHLGVLAQDRGDYESAAQSYQNALVLTQIIGDRRGALLWTLNLGIVRYEQGRGAEALPLLADGLAQAVDQGCKGLEAGARIFLGACLAAQGKREDGLHEIEHGLALAQSIGDQERVLMGYLQRGRVLAALGRHDDAIAGLQEGLSQAITGQMHRLEGYLQAEMELIERVQ